ncbi:MAG: hypothetical protein GY820_21730 [Gammaproteobacteria bacterium]|nr:hypothetical protein [Gammaproteobacteria bacterium]
MRRDLADNLLLRSENKRLHRQQKRDAKFEEAKLKEALEKIGGGAGAPKTTTTAADGKEKQQEEIKEEKSGEKQTEKKSAAAAIAMGGQDRGRTKKRKRPAKGKKTQPAAKQPAAMGGQPSPRGKMTVPLRQQQRRGWARPPGSGGGFIAPTDATQSGRRPPPFKSWGTSYE